MPLYMPVGLTAQQHRNDNTTQQASAVALRVQSILAHGSSAQQRRLLRMKALPTQNDLDAVAVLGIAVVDQIGEASTPLAIVHSRSSLSHHLSNDSGPPCITEEACRDFPSPFFYREEEVADMMDLLGPDGSSILESLPLAPPPPSGSMVCQSVETQCELESNEEALAASPHTLMDIPEGISANPSDPYIFVSSGSFSVGSQGRKRSTSRSTGLSNVASAGSLTSALPSASNHSVEGKGNSVDGCECSCFLSGRVVFTEEYVESSGNSLLQAMVQAYHHFTTRSRVVRTPILANTPAVRWQSSSQPPNSTLDRMRKELAHKQHGVVLAHRDIQPHVMRCIAAAERGHWPTFRRRAEREVYGSAKYINTLP